MSKFSKGKWEVYSSTDGIGVFDEDGELVETIADSIYGDKANARLIAAAPEMYNWLKTIAGVFDKGNIINVSGIKELLARIDGEEE